ncbi:hypothetical protein BCR35DRAFT_336117 [Leucosporidium creatinivorum]|uniref:Uncharacterized protein n=1 Tax=Leucosporidium creatinivorum TaxID=106004 RepID=A0A1Y2CPR7_9BASI|nr:hypothetical protein BCR35DRAFT_336117 [Leucosporidium creatinivorum]
MAAPIDKLWPQEGTVYRTKEDVLLACQLAALKAGFSALQLDTDVHRGLRWRRVRCGVQLNTGTCKRTLVRLELVDHEDELQGWRIVEAKKEQFEGSRHPKHIGTSKPLKLPQPALSCKVGDHFGEGQEMHLFEAALRISARQEGRYIFAYHGKPGQGTQGRFFACTEGRAACLFFVRLTDQDGRLIITQIDPNHSCTPRGIEPPGKKLASRMKHFSSIRLQAGLIGRRYAYGAPELHEEGSSTSGGQDIELDPPPLSKPSPFPLARNPSPSATGPSTTTLSHHGQLETNAERKERRRRERAQRTGVEETKEERAERRRLKKERKASTGKDKPKEVDERVKKQEKPASPAVKLGAETHRLAAVSPNAPSPTNSRPLKPDVKKKDQKVEKKEQKHVKPAVVESRAEKVKPRKQGKAAAEPIKNLPVPL